MILVSACLAGVRCRYDGDACPSPAVLELLARSMALPVCPEQLGGLPTPRPPCEQLHGRIRTANGDDCTEAFLAGAQEALRLGELAACTAAVLTARSPSCGPETVYDGSFSGRLVPGSGVFAALLREKGWRVYSDEDPALAALLRLTP